mgnify:CR=1 FL=1
MKKKRVMALLLAVLLAAGIAIPAAAADNQVIHIVTAEDLRTFARNCQLDSYSVGLSVLRTDLHYHMFCVKCKKASDAPHPYKPHLDEEIAEQSGNKNIRHRLIF